MVRKLGIAIAALSSLALTVSLAAAATVFDSSQAPSGTHVQTGTPICTISGLTVTCNSYELAGVGNTNARADLTASFSATVDCTNKGGNLVPVKASVQGASATTGQLEPKNGRLTVPSLSTSGTPTDQQFTSQATCPNGNWTKSVRPGSVTLSGFTYTLTFAGFSGAYITIT